MNAYQPLNNWIAEIAIPTTLTNTAIQEITSARLERASDDLAFCTNSLVRSTCLRVSAICGFGGIALLKDCCFSIASAIALALNTSGGMNGGFDGSVISMILGCPVKEGV